MSDEITEAAIREAVWGVPMAASLPHLRCDGESWVPRGETVRLDSVLDIPMNDDPGTAYIVPREDT